MLGINPPHSPYASTEDCDLEGYELYKDKSLGELLVRDNADTTMAKAAAARYYFANVSGIDREFGRLLATLDREGLTDNTIVVFASDHGETMTSHSVTDPKNSIWRESLNIPFVVRYPGRIAHRVDDLLLSSPDIMPTLLGLTGYDKPYFAYGQDIFEIRADSARVSERAFAINYLNESFQWITDSTAMFFDEHEVTHLFDLERDPLERHNLIEQGAKPDTAQVERMKALLQTYYERLEKSDFVVR